MIRQFLTLSLALLASVAITASARGSTLLGAGTTVQAFYFNSTFAGPEGEIPVGGSTTDPTSLAAPVDYTQGSADGSTIHVGDTQIVITNLLSGAPFCLGGQAGTACGDEIDGFRFKFTGESIASVTVDPASAASMLPVIGTFLGHTHLGLQFSANEVTIDLTGDLPNINDQLILDVSSQIVTPPAPTPLPATLPLFASGLGAFGLLGWCRKRRAVTA